MIVAGIILMWVFVVIALAILNTGFSDRDMKGRESHWQRYRR